MRALKLLGILIVPLGCFLAGAVSMFFIDHDYFNNRADSLYITARSSQLETYSKLLTMTPEAAQCNMFKYAKLTAEELETIEAEQMGFAKHFYGDPVMWRIHKNAALKEFQSIPISGCK